jgi:hypothetical protein
MLARLLAVLIGLLLSLSVAPARAEGAVRTGTTEVGEPAPAPTELETHAELPTPPGDAPHAGDDVRVPPAPPSFNTYDGGWIRFAYPPSVRERVQPLIADADLVRSELQARLGQPVLRRVNVYVARTPGEMATFAPDGAPFPKYAAGVAYSKIGLVLLTISPVYPNSRHDLLEIFKHELSHVALDDAVDGMAVPRWFNEGFAVFASGESSFTRLQTLWIATLGDDLLTLDHLDRSFPTDPTDASIAYAEAADVVRFLMRDQERHRFNSLIDRIRRGQSFDRALNDAYGSDPTTLEYEWREEVAKRYTFWPVFFSGTMVWFGALGLFVWGWRRRRRRNKETLARWAKEEAAEDELKRRRERGEEQARVHIVLSRASERAPRLRGPIPSETDVPKVEHDGQWHTLH